MTRPEDFEPDMVATLEAIDATLAGEAVDPGLADVAELALRWPTSGRELTPLSPRASTSARAPVRGRSAKGTAPVSWSVWAPSAAFLPRSSRRGGSRPGRAEAGGALVQRAADRGVICVEGRSRPHPSPCVRGVPRSHRPEPNSLHRRRAAVSAPGAQAPSTVNLPAARPHQPQGHPGRPTLPVHSVHPRRPGGPGGLQRHRPAEGIVKSSQVTANGGPGG